MNSPIMILSAGTRVRHRKHKLQGEVTKATNAKAHIQWENGMASWVKPNQIRVIRINNGPGHAPGHE